MKKKLFISFALLLVALVACGGHSSSDPAPAPAILTISNLNPSSTIIYANSGTAIWTIAFDDKNAHGAETYYVDLLDHNSNVVGTLSGPISNPNNLTEGTVTIQFPVDTSKLISGTSGFYTVWMTDSTQTSNKLTGAMNIL